jgi:protein involved in polysaccharide export with SLBB domain
LQQKVNCYDAAYPLTPYRPAIDSVILLRAKPHNPVNLRALALLFLAFLASCTNYEEKRIRQLLNEKGFGTRAEGRATMENYVAGGDGVVFLVNPSVFASPGAERLVLLSQVQRVGIDGTILVPYVGPVMILGLTERELKRLVESQLAAFFNIEVRVEARILNFGKVFYAFGEVGNKGRIPFVKSDLTLLEAITVIRPTQLANMGRVRVIKPDAENPMIIDVNIREMIMTGNTRYNILIEENDFIYIPPTWIGGFSRFIEKLLQPIGVAVQSLLGLATIKASYDLLRGEQTSFFFRY